MEVVGKRLSRLCGVRESEKNRHGGNARGRDAHTLTSKPPKPSANCYEADRPRGGLPVPRHQSSLSPCLLLSLALRTVVFRELLSNAWTTCASYCCIF